MKRSNVHTFGNSDMIIDFGIVLMIAPSARRWALDCLLPVMAVFISG
jgi:hypothetical protein